MQASESKPRILITGVTGFVGSHVAKLFTENLGETHIIRAAVRDTKNEAKLAPIRKALGEKLFALLELTELDMDSEESILNAMRDCEAIVHVASPTPENGYTNEQVVKIAKESAEVIIKGAKLHGLKKIILTSTSWSMNGMHLKYDPNSKYVYTEDDVQPEEGLFGVMLSCVAKERVFLNFAKQ